MEDALYLSSLYDIYSELLTEKQRHYFEDYYFNNLTLSEMAENYDVSRNAVHKQVKDACDKLVYYEEILHLKRKEEQILQLLEDVEDQKIKERIKELL